MSFQPWATQPGQPVPEDGGQNEVSSVPTMIEMADGSSYGATLPVIKGRVPRPGEAAPPEPPPPSRMEIDAKRDASNLAWLAQRQKDITPERAASILQVASALPKASYDFIDQNLDSLRGQLKSSQFDWEKLVKDHPALAPWIGDPTIGGAVLGQAASLRRLDAAVQGRVDLYKELRPHLAVAADVASGKVIAPNGMVYPVVPGWWEALTDAWTTGIEKWGLEFRKAVYPIFPIGHPGMYAQDPDRPAMLEPRIDQLSAKLDKDYIGDTGKGSLGWASRQFQTALLAPIKYSPLIAGGMVAGEAALAAGASATVGVGLFNFAYVAPGTMDRLSRLTNQKGERLSQLQSALIGLPLAGGEAAAMTWGLGPAVNTFFRGWAEGIGNGATAALSEYTFGQMIKTGLRRYGVEVMHGALGMTAQAVLDETGMQVTGAMALGVPMDPKRIARTAYDTAWQSMRDMAALSTWNGGHAFLREMGRMEIAKDTYARNLMLRESFQQMEGSDPLLQDKMARELVLQKGADKSQFFDLQSFDEHATKNGLDPREQAALLMGDNGEGYDRVKSEGQKDLMIPLDKARPLYTSKVWQDFAVIHGRYNPLALSPEGARLLNERVNKEAADQVAKPPSEVFKEEIDIIRQTVESQVRDAFESGGGAFKDQADTRAKEYAEYVLHAVMRMQVLINEGSPLLWYEKYFSSQKIFTGGAQKAVDIHAVSAEKQARTRAILRNAAAATFGTSRISVYDHDIPTILSHEFVHLLQNTYLKAAKEHPALAQEYEKMLGAMGYKSVEIEGIPAATIREEGRLPQFEERLTYAFEAYLAEGVPPDAKLADVFARIKSAIETPPEGPSKTSQEYAQERAKIYSDAYAPEVKPGEVLSPEIRDYFNEIFASQDAVSRAYRESGIAARLEELYKKVDPEAYAAYQKTTGEMNASARDNLMRWIREFSRQQNRAQFENERVNIRDWVEKNKEYDPTYAMIKYLTDGEVVGPRAEAVKELLGGAKILEDSVVRAFETFQGETSGKDAAAAFFRQVEDTHKKNFFTTDHEKGISVDAFGKLFGINAVDQTLVNLATSPKIGKYVEARTEEILREKYGPFLMGDESKAFAEQAMEEAHSSKAAERMFKEIRWMQGQLDPQRNMRATNLSVDALERLAGHMLANGTLGDLVPEKYVQNERRNAEIMIKALDEGNVGKAYDHQEARLLNFFMYKQARAMQKAFDKKLQYMVEHAAQDHWRGELGKADLSYRNASDALLKALGVMDGDGSPPDPRAWDAFTQFAQANDQPTIQFDSSLRDLISGAKAWRDLTPAQATAAFDAIKSIKHLANETQEVKLGEKQAKIDEVVTDAQQSISLLPEKPVKPTDRTVNKDEASIMKWLRSWKGNLLEPRVWLQRLGTKTFDLVWDGLVGARDAQEHMQKEVGAKFTDLWNEWQGKEDRYTVLPDLVKELPLDGDTSPRTKMWLLQMAGWFGNEIGRKRLLDYTGWTMDQVVSAFEKYLTHDDLMWVDRVHRLHDQYLYPLENAQYQRRIGLDLPKKAAMGYDVNGKHYEGGYWKLAYDLTDPNLARNKSDPGIMDRTSKGWTATSKGYEQDVATNFTARPNLNWETMPAHIQEVIHNITYGDFVHEAQKILLDPRMQQVINQRLGAEMAGQVQSLMEAAAHGPGSMPENLREISRQNGYMRFALVQGALGFGVRPVLAHAFHPIAASLMQRGVGFTVTQMVPAMLKVMWSRMDRARTGVDSLREESIALGATELTHRDNHAADEFRKIMGEPGRAGVEGTSIRRAVQEASFGMLEEMDRNVSHMIWRSNYDSLIGQGVDAAEAARQANHMVQSAMPTHMLAEMPAIMRDKKALGAMVVFYGYRSKLLQMAAEKGYEMVTKPFYEVRESGHYGTFATSIALYGGRVIGMLMFGIVAGDLMMGHGKDKDETWGQWTARRTVGAPFTMLPFGPEVAQPLADLAITGKFHPGNLMRNPSYSLIYTGLDTIGKLASHKRTTSEKIWDVAETLAFASALPAYQPRRTLEFATDWARGKQKPRSPGEAIHKLLFGEHSREASPFYTPR